MLRLLIHGTIIFFQHQSRFPVATLRITSRDHAVGNASSCHRSIGTKLAAIKSYFLSLGENDCPKFVWEYLKKCEDGEKSEESCILPPNF
jgi:hypothetical protein